MRRGLLTATIVAVGLLLATRYGVVQGQQFEAPKPGPEHKQLEPLIGTWNCKVKMWMDPGKDPTETEGTMTRKWIMDGRFVQEDFDGKFFGMPFKGLGLTGYDPGKKKYVGTWIDTLSLGFSTSESTYDAKTKTFNGTMEDLDPTGKKVKGRDVLKIVDADHCHHEMYRQPDGAKEMKVMEIHYTRVKK